MTEHELSLATFYAGWDVYQLRTALHVLHLYTSTLLHLTGSIIAC